MLKGDLVFQFVENHYRNFIEKFSFPLDIEYGSERLSPHKCHNPNFSRQATTKLVYADIFSSGDNKELYPFNSLHMKVVQ